ncbi:MAG: hypothetical protein JWM80_343 [Cyanobacteria bacterium RYN_339]|nr:hypothetical protein [Cyanobacteria bacterium RYN_339]
MALDTIRTGQSNVTATKPKAPNAAATGLKTVAQTKDYFVQTHPRNLPPNTVEVFGPLPLKDKNFWLAMGGVVGIFGAFGAMAGLVFTANVSAMLELGGYGLMIGGGAVAALGVLWAAGVGIRKLFGK